MKKEIVSYTLSSGKAPFEQWLAKLSKRDALLTARILKRFRAIQEHGHYGDYKYLRDGINELRYHFASGYRVYFAEDGDIVVLLLCAGDKSTQERDIKKAIDYWHDYQQRKEEQ